MLSTVQKFNIKKICDNLVYIWFQKSRVSSQAAFTHAGLTTRYRTKNLFKSTFVLSRSRRVDLSKTYLGEGGPSRDSARI